MSLNYGKTQMIGTMKLIDNEPIAKFKIGCLATRFARSGKFKLFNQKKLLYPQQVVFRKPADYSKVVDYKCKLVDYSKAVVYKL